MSMAQTRVIGAKKPFFFQLLSLLCVFITLSGCVAEHAPPAITALSPDLEASTLDLSVNDSVSSKTSLPSDENKPVQLTAYQFVSKARYGLPALNQEFPGTFGFSGNNVDHLLLGGGTSWQSQIAKNAGQVTTPLVLNAGRLFFGDDKGGLHAVSTSNGALLWTVHLSDSQAYEPIATLFADKNVLYAATRNGYIVALSTNDGAVRWKKKVTGIIIGALRSLGNALLLQIGSKQLITISKDKAEAGWHYKSENPIEALAVSRGAIQLLSDKNEFVYLEASTGKQKTKNEFSKAIEASQLVSTNNDLIISSKNGLSRYTPQRTKLLWGHKKGVEGKVIASGDAIFSMGLDNALRAYNRADGSINWRSKLPINTAIKTPARWSRPILAGGRLHLTSNTGYVASFNADDGKLVLLRNIKAPINSAPIVASGRLYIIAANGKVFRL